MTRPLVLRLNKSGSPLSWLTANQAAVLLVKEQVLWSLGENGVVLRGGYNRSGVQSRLIVPPIIATEGDVFFQRVVPRLNNAILFRRDNYQCLYCCQRFEPRHLTRDHVIPRSQKGTNAWQNIVTACRRCNHRKGAKTPEQAQMPLVAVPYAPNLFEFMVLANRRILADQMDFLQSGFSKNFRLQ